MPQRKKGMISCGNTKRKSWGWPWSGLGSGLQNCTFSMGHTPSLIFFHKFQLQLWLLQKHEEWRKVVHNFSIIPPTCPALRSYWPTSWVALASPPVVELITAGLGGFFMVPCVGWFSLLISPRVMSFTWTKTSQTISQHKILCVQFLWLQNNLLD